jgi:hypothetical protein
VLKFSKIDNNIGVKENAKFFAENRQHRPQEHVDRDVHYVGIFTDFGKKV